ncbi:unnamed protein product [Rotaria socialis]|uniref:Uncharacterized protein n=1 Tax=Rotaria socialis TaxID=392032 RepID=A0A818GEA4_9BILA|nr:unnamed protein product [Rotaria socialis]CAF4473397.1 unnamed protein product [Rotaria socialis]
MFRRNFSFPHQNNAQICQNTSDYQSCSSNIACGCFPLVSNDGQGICAHLHLKCSTLSVCAANNQTCFAPGHVCVKHSRCQSRPLCYPVHMASQHICPTPVLTTTTIAPLVPNDGICVTATWNPNGTTKAGGGNGFGNQLTNLLNPSSLFIDDDFNLFIADTFHNRIVKWSGNNRIQRWYHNDSQGVTLVQNTSCWGIAMDYEGSLYISSQTDESHVIKWPGEQTVAGGNGKGSALNQLAGASYFFVDRSQSIYIADGENDRIIKWSVGATEGVIVAGGNGRGNVTNQFNEPTAIVMDHMGTMYVTDYHNHRVTRWFNGSKTGVTIVGRRGEGDEPDQLRFQTDLTFDRNGNLWVADYINNRIQMFEIDKSSC